MSTHTNLQALKKSKPAANSANDAQMPNGKKPRLSSILIFLISATVLHGLTLPLIFQYLRLLGGQLDSISSVSNAVIQVMAYTGQMFLPFFDMFNRNYFGTSQAFADASGYTVTALFILQIIAGFALLLRFKRAWFYLAAIHILLIIITIWQIFTPGFTPQNFGMIVWPSFFLLLMFEGSVLQYVGLKRNQKLFTWLGFYTLMCAAVIFGGTLFVSSFIR